MTTQVTTRGQREAAHTAGVIDQVLVVTAVACLATHLVLLVAGGRLMLPLSLPMLAVSALCARCAAPGWVAKLSAARAWPMVAAGVAMVVFHLVVEHGGHGSAPTGLRGEVAHLLMHGGVCLGVAQAGLAGLAIAVARPGRPSVR